MAATATISSTVFTELLDNYQQSLIATFKKMLAEHSTSAPSSASEPAKRGRKPRDPSAPKIPSTNPWILFTKRVESIIRAKETAEDTPKESKMPTVRVKQFASDLKAKKGYEEWSDQDILTDLACWTPPEVSKQAKRAEAVPEPAPEPAPESVVPVPESVAPVPEPAAPVPEPAAATQETQPKKVKKTIKKAAPEPKKFDLRFYSWTHDGEDYYTNERGDVVTTDFEWVGRFDGTKIDESAPEPADLAEAEMKE